jgi:hypothetical protein
MKLLLAVVMLVALVLSKAWTQEARLKQAIPPKGYHVSLVPDSRYAIGKIVGRIPESENLEINAEAEAITSERSITLKGKARLTVSIGGKAMASYEGEELILTPTAVAAEPLNHQEVSAKLKEFDAAAARRDSETMAKFFSEDAKISVESLTTTGVQTKTYTRQEYAGYLKAVFPNALRLTIEDQFTGSLGNNDENPGYGMSVSKDGITANGKYNVRYAIALPEGLLHWRVNRKLAVEMRGMEFLITALEVTLPNSVKENWPEAKQDQFGRSRIIQPR